MISWFIAFSLITPILINITQNKFFALTPFLFLMPSISKIKIFENLNKIILLLFLATPFMIKHHLGMEYYRGVLFLIFSVIVFLSVRIDSGDIIKSSQNLIIFYFFIYFLEQMFLIAGGRDFLVNIFPSSDEIIGYKPYVAANFLTSAGLLVTGANGFLLGSQGSSILAVLLICMLYFNPFQPFRLLKRSRFYLVIACTAFILSFTQTAIISLLGLALLCVFMSLRRSSSSGAFLAAIIVCCLLVSNLALTASGTILIFKANDYQDLLEYKTIASSIFQYISEVDLLTLFVGSGAKPRWSEIAGLALLDVNGLIGLAVFIWIFFQAIWLLGRCDYQVTDMKRVALSFCVVNLISLMHYGSAIEPGLVNLFGMYAAILISEDIT